VCVCVCVCVRARARARVCVCVCLHMCLHAHARTHARMVHTTLVLCLRQSIDIIIMKIENKDTFALIHRLQMIFYYETIVV